MAYESEVVVGEHYISQISSNLSESRTFRTIHTLAILAPLQSVRREGNQIAGGDLADSTPAPELWTLYTLPV